MGLPRSFGKKKTDRGKGKPSAKQSDVDTQKKSQKDPLKKYFAQRYQYFSMYEYGIMIDRVGWFSVTPEAIACHIASRVSCKLLIDAFCGVGGNTIQFAKTCDYVIAIDLDPVRLACARHNATIYGVAHKIDFVLGSFLDYIPRAKADVVYLAPPWGGPEYQHAEIFDVETMIPMNGKTLYQKAKSITPNIIYQLPRNIDKTQVALLAVLPPLDVDGQEVARQTGQADRDDVCEVEDNFLAGAVKMTTVYYGALIKQGV